MSSGVPPPKRSQTGATGSSKVPTPPPRAKSFAFFSRDKNKKKLKTASISSYRLDTEEQKVKLEDWLVGRFGVSKAELKLVLKRDFYRFNILEQDDITKEDESVVEAMRSTEEENHGGT